MPTPTAPTRTTSMVDAPVDEHPLRRLWRYAGGHRRAIVVASVLSVLNKLVDIAPPFLIGAAVDIVVAQQDSWVAEVFGVTELRTQIVVLAAVSAGVWVLESVFEYLYSVGWRNLAQTIQHEARLDAYAHVQDLELAYFEDRSTGGLMSVLNDDVNQLERFLDTGANDILQVLTTVVAIGGAFFWLVPGIAPFAFLPVPIILWGSFRFQRSLEPRYAEVRDKVGLLNGSLANNLGGIATIKAFTAEQREIDRIAAESDEYRLANREAIRLSSAFMPLIRMAILIGFTAILILGGFEALDGALAVGTYSVLVFLTQRLLWPLTRLGETFDDYQRAMASVRRLMDLLAVRPSILPGPSSLDRPVRGEVDLDGVRFAYTSGEEVIRRLDLHVPPGRTHAIVGSTGAGMSTVVKLLLRLYDPTAGTIRLDGTDVRELGFDALRGSMGLVSQDVFLFHGTVRDNIAYGDPDATDEAIRHAADLAEVTEFVATMPQGFDTMVGERGQKLSGGQRQRISIARATCATRPCSSSTRRPRPWTTRPRLPSSARWPASPRIARRS